MDEPRFTGFSALIWNRFSAPWSFPFQIPKFALWPLQPSGYLFVKSTPSSISRFFWFRGSAGAQSSCQRSNERWQPGPFCFHTHICGKCRVHAVCVWLDCKRKLENLQRTHVDAWSDSVNHCTTESPSTLEHFILIIPFTFIIDLTF